VWDEEGLVAILGCCYSVSGCLGLDVLER